MLLQYGADASTPDERKSTPLHRASERGHLNVARVLIKHGAKGGCPGRRQIGSAACVVARWVSEVLLIAGADTKSQDGDRSTPLHWASQGGHLDIVRVLLNHGAGA